MTHTHDHQEHDHEHSHESTNGHKASHDLHHEVHAAGAKVTPGAYYIHYKNGLRYRLLGLGFIEATDTLAAIYQEDHGEHIMFIRPFDEFIEEVDGKPRFAKLD